VRAEALHLAVRAEVHETAGVVDLLRALRHVMWFQSSSRP
jgi:hypothetical protein